MNRLHDSPNPLPSPSNTLDFVELSKQVWLKPSAVIRRVVDVDPTFMIQRLMVYTFLISGMFPIYQGIPLMSLNILLTVIFGYTSVYLTAALLWLTGKPLGGKASFAELVASLVWCLVPTLALGIVQFGLSMAGPELETPAQLIGLLGFLWSMKIALWMITEVQGFSMRKCLLNNLLALVASLIPLVPAILILMPQINAAKQALLGS